MLCNYCKVQFSSRCVLGILMYMLQRHMSTLKRTMDDCEADGDPLGMLLHTSSDYKMGYTLYLNYIFIVRIKQVL